MCKYKNHWYDGLFYDKLIAPAQDKSFQIIKSIITENSSVLDVGCGTGRLAFQLSDKCKIIDGIDPSRRNIDLANRNLLNNPSSRIAFHHADVHNFLQNKDRCYDYAVVSYVFHEMDENEREGILCLLSDVADKIIIVDYLYPRPKVFWSVLNEAIEFAAGRDHYRNFKSFLKKRGLMGHVQRAEIQIIYELKNKPATSHVLVLKKFDCNP